MLEFDGVTGEIVDSYLRVYTTDESVAYQFYVAWRRSLGKKPVSSNSLPFWTGETWVDIQLGSYFA